MLGARHPYTLVSMADLAALLQGPGQLTEAQGLLKQAVQLSTHVLSGDHPRTLGFIAKLDSLNAAIKAQAQAGAPVPAAV